MAIESANIVGYTTANKVGQQYVCLGPCFISTGSDNTFKMGDIKGKGTSSSGDMFQMLNPTTSKVSDTFYYYSFEESIRDGGDGSDAGWYDQSLEISKDDVEFSAGDAFLANLGTKQVELTYAGQVIDGNVELDFVGKQYVVVPNFLPRRITLGEIVCSGTSSSGDMFQKLNPSTSKVSDTFYYYSKEESIRDGGDGSDAGWYDQSLEVSKDEIEIEAGEALLANLGTKNVKMVFPAAIEK